MSQKLNIRWLIILGAILASCYFIMPTYEFYSIKNDPDLIDKLWGYLCDCKSIRERMNYNWDLDKEE